MVVPILKTRLFLLAATLGIALGFTLPAHAQVAHLYFVDLNSKEVTPLGLSGDYATDAIAINDAGQVLGRSYTDPGDSYIFITGPNGVGRTDLNLMAGVESATAINDTGRVTGFAFGAAPAIHAFITGPNGVGRTDLGSVGGGDYDPSYGYGINNTGQVVGYYVTAGGPEHAFITGLNGVGMTDLGTPGAYSSRATAINDAGQVVGEYNNGEGDHAFITGPNGVGMTDLGIPGGSEAYAINEAGQVAGTSYERGNFITGPDGVGITYLDGVGFASNNNNSTIINDAGQVVGSSVVPGAGFGHAVITGPNGVGMTDLNSLVNPGSPVLTEAFAINNHGQIIAAGEAPIPPISEPETYALLLAGLALIGIMAARNSRI
ncbi:MAG: hypothetical protein BGO99_00020 [Nitrosospira sp. 56-18]|jgi:probable HAF family extracellular repeat protein|nr:HAF repeat-containing protein [Nitrosospira sp.]OJY07702.1 MAG: hypothetical protein BGO99_00020 [Nitrosospira sp. 56-18]